MTENKYQKLRNYLQELGRVAVAFSSGVDSTFLLKVAHDVLKDNAIAITARSCSFPKRELKEAVNFCNKEGIKHIIMDFEEFQIDGFRENPANRCYLCKKELFKKIWEIAKSNEIENLIEGSNADDDSDYRPGLQAIKELGVISPLRVVGLSKNDIRQLSKKLYLPTWDKPSFACLASRFAYGELITKDKLFMVENAEQLLLDKGFTQVRVRIHDKVARIEVLPEDFGKLMNYRDEILDKFSKYGFIYVTMDLKGYRTGSMNEVLNHSE